MGSWEQTGWKTIPSITRFWCRIIISTRFIWHLTGTDTGLDWHGVLNDAVMIVCRLDIIVHMTVHACSNHSIQLHLGCVGYWIPNKIFSESSLFFLFFNPFQISWFWTTWNFSDSCSKHAYKKSLSSFTSCEVIIKSRSKQNTAIWMSKNFIQTFFQEEYSLFCS